jgi:sec-independent protein translocase protein TatB
MFDLSGLEIAVIAAVIIMAFGPKELPGLLRQLGQLMGKARAMSRHLRSGLDEMIRQAEMEEMEKQWRDQNARIMAEHPAVPAADASAAAPPVPPVDFPVPGQPDPSAEAPPEGAAAQPVLDPFSGRPVTEEAPPASGPQEVASDPQPDSKAA